MEQKQPMKPQRVMTRKSHSGRRPGESGTRAAIEAAARRQFADLGYDRASLRAIALEAGVDPALVLHYFGSKPQLFAAVLAPPFDPSRVLPELLAGDQAAAGERLARFVLGVMASEEGRRWFTGLVRAAASEPAAAHLVREFINEKVLLPLAESLDADDAPLRAALAGSQIVGLAVARLIIGVEPLTSTDSDTLAAAIAPTLQRYLTAPLA
jgi:AcrR family transcriptional regulator